MIISQVTQPSIANVYIKSHNPACQHAAALTCRAHMSYANLGTFPRGIETMKKHMHQICSETPKKNSVIHTLQDIMV